MIEFDLMDWESCVWTVTFEGYLTRVQRYSYVVLPRPTGEDE